MTLAKFGQGAALTRAGNAIAEITDVTLPNPKAAVLKVTNHASPSGWEEKIYGLIDGDKVQVTCNFRPDDTNGQMGLIADRGGRVIQTFVLTAPPAIGISLQFSGLVVQAQPIFPKDKEATFKAEIEVTGIVTYNTNASTNLTNLSATLTTLVPSFSGAVYEYDGIVTPGSTSVTVTPTNATAITILVNGIVVASGSASGAISTAIGNTNVTIITQDATKSPVVYLIHLSRAS